MMTTKSCVSLGFVGLAAASPALAASPADAAGQLSFERVDAVVGSPTNAIRASDLNADGRLDLVDSGGQRAFVLTGRGDGRFDPSWSGAAGENPSEEDGGFRPRTTLPAPFGPFSVVAADLNGDGRQDVAAASGEERGTLATWHGLVDGSFRAAGRYEIARGPTKSAAADLTGDGRAEVIVACYAAGEVAVLIGGGTPAGSSHRGRGESLRLGNRGLRW